ncbi:OPT oligopeptide transporter protein-domain-containing protein [Boletus reticuloceps]|uniref:OPT oligopeptide transporter protein-domain-containing protein n=1 Tax=Boletus reticuloceps TaxID=495285 RepID=A0A8I2YPF3_9AGAM|nr:OPT oligopeptide transporter protein-domain-containing protein [Boletus reticuloceps]
MVNEDSNIQPDGYPTTLPSCSDEKPFEEDEKSHYAKTDVEAALNPPTDDASDIVLHSEREIATHVISVDDDPSLNPWTFRAFFLGLGLSAFGGSLAEIYYFKPQTVLVSLMFLAIISYVLGFAMETFIPRHGLFRYLNPHPFNRKENAFIIIMASAAAHSALATEVLAVQRLYYNITPNAAISIFLLFSSQLLGYGIGGVLRPILLYPSKMLYPSVLPLISMFDAFFRDGATARRKLKTFYIVFGVIFIWELFPEWIFPLLTGFSIICLAAPNNAAVSRVFGGSDGNEGLGLLSICFDWQVGFRRTDSLVEKLISHCVVHFRWHQPHGNSFEGTGKLKADRVTNGYGSFSSLSFTTTSGNQQNFPFLSQLLFYENGTVYDQLLILNSNFEVDPTLLAEQGLPYYAGTWVVYLLSTNLGLAATFTHLLLWNRDDLRGAWSWMSPSNLRKKWQDSRWGNVNWRFWNDDGIRGRPREDEDIDPHYAEMLKYPDAPNSWYYATFVVAFAVALVVIYKGNSTLPWWGFVVSVLLAIIFILFVGALYAITGINISVQTFVQMIAGYLHPGQPMANMYFVLYSYNTVVQAGLLLRDLKIGQYAKLPPRASFTAQIIGILLGAILNYFLMNSIIDSQREILLSVQGTNIWSGQQPQQYNSQAIAWGGLGHELFSAGKRYQWVPLSYLVGLVAPVPFWLVHRYWPRFRTDYVYIPIVCAFIGWLCVGINSSSLSLFAVAFLSQWWIRTRYPRWFQKYNYIVAAALDGGMQVMVFILSFAVQGAAGTAHLFPAWWGANQGGNYDRCLYLN